MRDEPNRLNPRWPSNRTSQTAVDLQWEFHPLVLISREASRLRNDSGELEVAAEGSPNLTRLAKSDHPWSALVQTEGAKTVIAKSSSERPTLDGKLTEDCWKQVITLSGGTSLHAAYDILMFLQVRQ